MKKCQRNLKKNNKNKAKTLKPKKIQKQFIRKVRKMSRKKKCSDV